MLNFSQIIYKYLQFPVGFFPSKFADVTADFLIMMPSKSSTHTLLALPV
jgi:hypothetical protein